MKKEAFLRALDKRLEGMSAEERARALEFCAESIDDRVEDGMDEEDAVAALGDVETWRAACLPTGRWGRWCASACGAKATPGAWCC